MAKFGPFDYGLGVLIRAVVIAAAAVIAGLVLVFTVDSLIGPILIIGGIAGLGWTMAPAVIARITRWLSVGR